MNDLLGGQVTMMFTQLSSALPQIRAGKLRALGLASLTRSAAVPEVHDKLTAQGMTVTSDTPAQLAATIRSETQRWAEVIRRQNIQPQ